MNTVSPNDDLFANFFQVDQYSNVSGVFNNPVITRAIDERKSLSELANQRGQAYNAFRNTYERITQEFDLSKGVVDDVYNDWKERGNSYADMSGFYKFVQGIFKKEKEQSTESSVKPPKVDSVDVSDVDFRDDLKKNNLTPLYIGIGVVALVAITVLLVRKK